MYQGCYSYFAEKVPLEANWAEYWNVYHSLMVKLTFSSFALTSLTAFLPPLTPLDVLVLY